MSERESERITEWKDKIYIDQRVGDIYCNDVYHTYNDIYQVVFHIFFRCLINFDDNASRTSGLSPKRSCSKSLAAQQNPKLMVAGAEQWALLNPAILIQNQDFKQILIEIVRYSTITYDY